MVFKNRKIKKHMILDLLQSTEYVLPYEYLKTCTLKELHVLYMREKFISYSCSPNEIEKYLKEGKHQWYKKYKAFYKIGDDPFNKKEKSK